MAKDIGHLKTIPLVLLVLLVLQACNSEGGTSATMSRRPVSYLTEVIPPCVPVEGSTLDPCLLGTTPSVVLNSLDYIILPDTLPTFTEILTEVPRSAVSHIIIRGTVLPDSARCGIYPLIVENYEPADFQEWVKRLLHYYCFVEVRVNEYIVGEGPARLTVIIAGQALGAPLENWGVDSSGESEELDRSLGNPPSKIEETYAGKEMVLFLSISRSLLVESWAATEGYKWFVQRDGDEVRAVSDQVYLARTPEHHRRLDMPLADLVREVKQAHENRLVITEGRIGVESFLPMLITDANRLQDHYGAVGAVYEGEGATVLPPPVPGGDEPAQPPAPAGEDPPGDTVPAPGEETTSPPPTDDAGQQPSTTAAPPPDLTSTSNPAPAGADPAAPSPTVVPQPQTEETSPTDAPAPSDGSQPLPGTTLPPAEDAPPAPAG